eukprot:1836349-Amphidinium_carterae.1
MGPAGQRGRRRATSPTADESAMALQAAALLLTKPWLARLPLIDEGTTTSGQAGSFTEVSVLAVRWAGAVAGPVSSCVVAVPAGAVEGLLETCETFVAKIHADGPTPTTEVCEIAVLYYGPEFLRDSLAESSPHEAHVISFSNVGSGGLPIGAEVDLLDLPEEFQSGMMAKTRLDLNGVSQVVVYDLAGDAENYITAASTAEDETVNPLLTLSTPQVRRRVGRAASAGLPSELGSMFGPGSQSARPGALSATLAPPAAPLPIATGGARPKAPAARSKAAAKAPSLAQVLEAVHGMAERMTVMEQRIATPSMPTQPPPQCPTARAPAAAQYSVPPPAAPPPGLGASVSMLAPGRFRPTYMPAGVPVPGAGMSQAQQIVASLGAPAVPMAASPHGAWEPERHGRDRQADAALRAAVEIGGSEANTAVQLAMLEALQRLGGKAASTDDVDLMLEDDTTDLDGNIQKLASGARGAAA